MNFARSHAAWVGMSLIILLGMAACGSVTPPSKQANVVAERPSAGDSTGGFDWAWDISGDPQIRPMQVFSNKESTWLQMGPRQVMPAVFVGGSPVPFELNAPYIKILGSPDRIELVATAYRAIVVKRNLPADTTGAHSNDRGRLSVVPDASIQTAPQKD